MDNINLNRENGQKLWAADWNKLISTINLIIDAVNNQSNLPGITKLSQLINDSGFITQEDVKGKVNKGELAEVATSGSYNDLKDKPSQMTGPQGPEGKSAYQVAVLNGFIGTPQLWLDSLKGEDGLPGLRGENGIDGQDGLDGADGKSAYELAVELGYEGTLELWLESLHGQDGQGVDETLDANGHDYVEIEGVKWATKNIGALDIYDLGTSFNSDLEITDEASSWGGDWRSPTKEEFYSLILLCRVIRTTINNVWGIKCIYKKDPSITLFFPGIENHGYKIKNNRGVISGTFRNSDIAFYDKYVKTLEDFEITASVNGEVPKGYIRPVLKKYDYSSKLIYRPTVVDSECSNDDDFYGGMSIYNDELAINWNGHENSAYKIYKNKCDVLFFMSRTTSSKYYNADTGESSNNISNIILSSYNYDSVYQKFYDEFGGDWELPQRDDLLLLLLNNKITVNWDEEYFTIGNNIKRYFLDYKLYDAYTGEETEYRGFVGAASSLEIDTTSSKRVFINSGSGIIGKTIGIVHCSTPQTLILSEVSVSGDYNDLKNKPTIPAALIQADWNQTDNTQADYIKNKPTITNGNTPSIDPTSKHWIIGSTDTGVVAEGLNGQNGTNGTDGHTPLIAASKNNGVTTITSDGVAIATINDGQDGSVANQLQADWNQLDNSLVDYIKNKPAIPVAVSDLQNNLGFLAIANEHEYIEIGGLKWATMNVGANSVTDIGLYFQWGDTQGYTANQVGSGSGQKYFGWDDYKYTNDGGTTMSKYNSTDGKTVLEASDDAVTAAWGSQWRTPTYNEFLILSNATTITFTENYKGSGVAGMVCTDKTDNSKVLFFPLTGECSNGNINDNMSGGYWTGDFSKSDARCSNAVEFYKNAYDWGGPNWDIGVGRNVGFAIRGIMHPSIQKFAANVAISGDYNDLSNKPTIPAAPVQSDWNETDTSSLAYIANKPTIPAALVLSDWNATTGLGVILNKPTIPTVPANETATSGGTTLSVVTTGDKYNWNNKANVWQGTQVQYDALSPNYDSNTIYIITES